MSSDQPDLAHEEKQGHNVSLTNEPTCSSSIPRLISTSSSMKRWTFTRPMMDPRSSKIPRLLLLSADEKENQQDREKYQENENGPIDTTKIISSDSFSLSPMLCSSTTPVLPEKVEKRVAAVENQVKPDDLNSSKSLSIEKSNLMADQLHIARCLENELIRDNIRLKLQIQHLQDDVAFYYQLLTQIEDIALQYKIRLSSSTSFSQSAQLAPILEKLHTIISSQPSTI